MKTLKILFITPTLFGVRGTTGTFRFISILAQSHDVLVITPDDSSQEQHVVYTNNDITPIRIGDRSNRHNLFKIKRVISKFRPDVIYIFNSPYILNYLFQLKPLFQKIKWIADFKTPLLQEGKIRKKIRMKSFLAQFYLDAIFTLSRHSTRTWVPFLMRQTFEYPLGLDLSVFSPKKITAKIIYCHKFVFIGSLHPHRKLDFLINSFQQIIESNPGIPFSLDIYGSGAASKQLQQIINNKKIKRIKLCGLLDQNSMFDKLTDYDAGIAYVPYQKYNRSPSLKAIEYAAAGLPVFASDTIGHKLQMKHGLSFYTFQNKDKSLQKAIVNSAKTGVASKTVLTNLENISCFDYNTIIKNYIEPWLLGLVDAK